MPMTEPFDPVPARHDEFLELMPWYVSGALEPAERARFETHLGGCAACQAELAIERRLHAEVSAMPLDVEIGWAAMRARLDPHAPRWGSPARPRHRAPAAWLRWLPAGGAIAQPSVSWALAAQAFAIVVLGALLLWPAPAARYHALGSLPANATGNVVVMFRPDMRADAMSQLLTGVDARIVDGPNEAGAYLVRVPAVGRRGALAKLRGQPDVALAEPVDAGGSP
jgi:anti-sigma factor RsiW